MNPTRRILPDLRNLKYFGWMLLPEVSYHKNGGLNAIRHDNRDHFFSSEKMFSKRT